MIKCLSLTATLAALCLFALTALAGCAIVTGQTQSIAYQAAPYDGAANNTEPHEPDIRWARPPAVFVNDTWFQIFVERNNQIPPLDDSWTFLGTIQTIVAGYLPLTENFQSNMDLLGARIYHNYLGRIPVTNNTWGEPIDEEAFGESIIVVYENRRIMFISEESMAEVLTVMKNNGARRSLNIDGTVYSLMATAGGGHFAIGESHIFLGEIISSSDINEYPTENLTANRPDLIGARAYRLPEGEVNDIVVFHSPATRFYFSLLN